MTFKEITSRLTGISCPIFGISWTAPTPEVAIARALIAFLEDRRVLFNPGELECPEHCAQSILRIREELTRVLGQPALSKDFDESLRAMRAACRKFLDLTHTSGPILLRHGWDMGHSESWTFLPAVGELRGVFGIHIARIAAQYGLDVEDQLAAILPANHDVDALPGRGVLDDYR